MENSHDIFEKHEKNKDISGKITYTNIMESIPENYLEQPIINWKQKYKTEWRWRILKFSTENEEKKYVVEISYMKYNSNKRIYFNRFGEWVERTIDPIFDQFVIKQYYVYNE